MGLTSTVYKRVLEGRRRVKLVLFSVSLECHKMFRNMLDQRYIENLE